MAYSDYDKAMAVEIIARNNGVLDVSTLADIRVALSAPDLKQQTVRYWIKMNRPDQKQTILSEEKKATNKPDASKVEVTQKVRRALDQKLEIAAHKFVNHATKTNVLKDMSGQQAMTSAAIAIDKMRLLRDLPTEIIGAAPELTELANFFRANNIEMSSAIREWREKLEARKAATNVKQSEVKDA